LDHGALFKVFAIKKILQIKLPILYSKMDICFNVFLNSCRYPIVFLKQIINDGRRNTLYIALLAHLSTVYGDPGKDAMELHGWENDFF